MISGARYRGPAAHAALIVAGWTVYGAVFGAQAVLSRAVRGEPIVWGQTLATWLALSYAWALLTPLVLWLAARFPLERPRLARALALHAAAGAAVVAVNLGLFAVVAPFVGAATAETWVGTFSRLLASAFVLDLLVYWALVGSANTVRLARVARERERRALQLEARLAEARLLALRAQIRPHFLFNALNTVSVLMHEDAEAADRVLGLLSELLRRTLDTSETHEVSLREEIAFLEAYLAIEQTRFADRLSYRIDVAPDVLDARVPSLVLQPLVENAVRHGVARRIAPGCVEIAAEQSDGTLRMTVRDNGPGMDEGATEGIGLSNTRARLQHLYGSDHCFQLVGAQGGGLEVSLAIPLRCRRAT